MLHTFIQLNQERNLLLACRNAVDTYLPYAREDVFRRDLLKICEVKNIPVTFQEDTPFEGRLSWAGHGRYRITLRKNQDGQGKSGSQQSRLRFTLAHELGHWVFQQIMGNPQNYSFRSTKIDAAAHADEEFAADQIAAEILMPMDDICEENLGPRFDSVDYLEKRYNVNRSCALRRISDISDGRILSLKLLPTKFADASSPAFVDDAWLVQPMHCSQRVGNKVSLIEDVPFSEVATIHDGICRLRIDGEEVDIDGDYRSRGGIIPRIEVIGSYSHA